MAGRGPAPKPNAVRRNAPSFEWVQLPAEGRQDPAPELPDWRDWTEATSEWWVDLWSTPQACAWDQSGRSLWVLAVLFDELMLGERAPAAIAAEMRQHEDRHGLSPKAMLALRWKIVADEVAEQRESKTPAKRTRKPSAKKVAASSAAVRRLRN